ncbi:hypothetical protein [Paenibacillus riograndensis]|nr:hypothetical protein [Paenibacillus riograndensis]
MFGMFIIALLNHINPPGYR